MKNLKKIIKLIIIIVIIAIIALILNFTIYVRYANTQMQIMNNLDYNVTLNEDGSMTVVETWDIYISKTNTIFKNFELSSKFGDITNVTVKDLDTGKNLTQIYQEMYHVTTGCYYALEVSGGMFEIAWGTGMEYSIGNKKYQITYTVTDVITDYKDCQELYWQFLSSSNAIPIKNVTGTITLPENVADISNLRAWGHGPLNGEVSIESSNCVKFEVDGLNAGKMLELRVVTTDKMFNVSEQSKIANYSYLSNIIEEETEWANESNDASQIVQGILGDILIVVGVSYCIIILVQIIRIIQYWNFYKNKNDVIHKLGIQYYRDIPRENKSTPAEANYLYHFTKDLNDVKDFQADTVAGIILDLALKKYISIECYEDEVYIKILKDSDGLKEDEESIYKLLKNASGGEKEYPISKLNKYAKKNYQTYGNLINKMVNSSRESLYKEELVDRAEKKMYTKSKHAEYTYKSLFRFLGFAIIYYLISLIPIFLNGHIIMFGINYASGCLKILVALAPIIATVLIKNKILSKLQNKIAVLTQKGSEEKEQWEGLARYMEDFSMLDEKEIPSLVVWEKYLVYATTFGIAEKVIEQMKAKYPEVFIKEYWEDEKVREYPILNFSIYNGLIYDTPHRSPIHSITNITESAYKTSLAEIARHSASSGSGGGGGFSGGGGGRRRRWPEWEEDSTIAINRME